VNETREVCWERLLPAEFREAMAALPVVFLPLGTVEWHGEHNALGLDKPATVVMEPELAWENQLLRPWLEQLCAEFHRNGARGIVMLTGHYGHNQQIVVRETTVRMTRRLRIPVLGTPEYWLAHDAGYLGDHAGVGETSLLLHLHPDLVDMEREDGEFHAAASSSALGARYAGVIVERLSAVARAMPHWDAETLDAFADAESSLVNIQTRLWREVHPWEAWRRLIERGLHGYGAALASGDFAAVRALAGQLA